MSALPLILAALCLLVIGGFGGIYVTWWLLHRNEKSYELYLWELEQAIRKGRR